VKALTQPELLEWLHESRPSRLQLLYGWADRVRKEWVGDAVHLRGLIEISSHCARQCMYCGLRAANKQLTRYRMEREEILNCALEAEQLGYGTVVMQAGEDGEIKADWMAEIVHWIKRETRLAVTLSLRIATCFALKLRTRSCFARFIRAAMRWGRIASNCCAH
jgi:biotin synthase